MSHKKIFTTSDLITEIEQLIDNGMFDEAYSYCVDLGKKNPDNFLIYYYLAKISLQTGNKEDCLINLKQANNLKSGSLAYISEIGNMFFTLGYFADAREVFKKGQDLYPDSFEMPFNIAISYLNEKKFADALEYFKQAKKIKDFFDVNFQIASCYYNLQDAESGLEPINHAIELEPYNPLGYACLASIKEIMGKKDEALKYYDKTLSLNDRYYKVYYSIATLKKFDREKDREFLAKLLSHIEDKSIDDVGMCYLHYALGKFYDDCNEYKNAFTAFEKANFYKAKFVKYDEDIAKTLAYTRSIFTPETLKNKNKTTSSDLPRPVFIVGMPRTGSTLIEQIMSSHSQIAAAGEVIYLSDIINQMAEEQAITYPDCVELLDEDELAHYAEEYLKMLSKNLGNAKFISNKTPMNFANIGLISCIFPDPVIINSKRHPLDACLSIFITDFSQMELAYSSDLVKIAYYYKEYEKMMKYWHSVLPGAVYDCYYEELVAKQEPISKELIKLCDLDWEEACASFYKTKSTVYTASKTQVRQPIYKGSVYRWKNYEEQLAEVKEILSDEIAEYEEEIFRRIGE